METEDSKLLVIHTGGSSIMQENDSGTLEPSKELQKNLFDYIPGAKDIVNFDYICLFQLDSSDFHARHWKLIADTIYNNYNDYSGFVIMHGSDTMAYTASMLSFMLQDLGKPVILTDTVVPVYENSSRIYYNIINSLRFASLDFAEVAIVFGDNMFRGNRSKKIHELAVNSFASPNFPRLGKVDIDMQLSDLCKKPHHRKLKLKTDIVTDVVVLKIFPGISNEHVLGMVPPRTKGVVIEGYGAGNIPLGEDGIEDSIQSIVHNDIPVVIDTQCTYGGVDYGRYIGGAFAKQHGALSSHDLTSEAAVTKLMWVLGQTEDKKEIKTLFESNLAGELTEIKSN